jgi:hypothetical protein
MVIFHSYVKLPEGNGSFGCSKGESAGNRQFVRLSHQNIEAALQILQLWEFDGIWMNLVGSSFKN